MHLQYKCMLRNVGRAPYLWCIYWVHHTLGDCVGWLAWMRTHVRVPRAQVYGLSIFGRPG